MTAKTALRIIAEERTLILSVVVLTVASAVLVGRVAPADVTAVAQLQVYTTDESTAVLALTEPAERADRDVIVGTHVRLASSPTVARRVIERLGLTDTPSELLERIAISAPGQANVLTVEAQARSAADAATLADTWVAEYIAWSAERTAADFTAASAALAPQLESAKARITDIDARIKTQGHTKDLDTALAAATTHYEQLLLGAQRLDTLARVAQPPLSIVSPALAEESSTVSAVAIDALKGLVAGIVLGTLLGFIRHVALRPEPST